MSVVKGKCLPLLSRQACSQLGLKIDCGSHSFGSFRMGIRSFSLSQASNGHYLLPISTFDLDHVTDIPEDFLLEIGQEAFIFRKAGITDQTDAAAVMFEHSTDCPTRVVTSPASPRDTNMAARGSGASEPALKAKIPPSAPATCNLCGEAGHRV